GREGAGVGCPAAVGGREREQPGVAPGLRFASPPARQSLAGPPAPAEVRGARGGGGAPGARGQEGGLGAAARARGEEDGVRLRLAWGWRAGRGGQRAPRCWGGPAGGRPVLRGGAARAEGERRPARGG